MNTPKIAFLFLTVSDLNKPDIWQNFFKGNESKFNIYAHSKDHRGIETDILLNNQIPNKESYTKWGDVSLVNATIKLLKSALNDKNNQFFVLVSESCIPLYDFDYVYNTIIDNNKSWVFYYKQNSSLNKIRWLSMFKHRVNKGKRVPYDGFFKQSQFMILSRSHAKFLCESNNDNTKIYRYMQAPDEYYFINTLKHNYVNFDLENINYPATYVNRINGKRGHPVCFDEVNLSQIKNDCCIKYFIIDDYLTKDKKVSLFLRKINKDTIIYE